MLTKKNFPFSTNREILEGLKEEAEAKNQSVNALVNDILHQYVSYYKHIERKGKVIIPQKSFQFMLENVDEKIILDCIKRNELDFYTLFATKRIPFTFENFVSYALEGVGKARGFINYFSVYKDSENYTHVLL